MIRVVTTDLSDGDGPDVPLTPRDPGVAAKGLIVAVRTYQLARAGRPSGCRFLPSCSEYAIGAIEAHGAVRGAGLAARRLARCHPWGGHGVDPVPGREVPCSR